MPLQTNRKMVFSHSFKSNLFVRPIYFFKNEMNYKSTNIFDICKKKMSYFKINFYNIIFLIIVFQNKICK